MQLFDATNLAPSLRDRGWIGPDEPVAVRELTGGVSNVVLYVARSASPGGDFVVKQSRPQLRVAETWLCTVERIWREVDALRYCGELTEICRPDEREGECVATPRVLFESRADYLYGMTAAPPGSHTWKEELLSGAAEPEVARAMGEWLGRLHAKTWKSADVAARFGDRQLFDELRLDPYYRQLGRRFPEWRPRLEDLVDQVWAHPLALVHADYSPKNLLVWPDGLMLVDFETAHYGDPAFDLGFLLAHLALKTAWARQRQLDYRPLVDAFWNAYLMQMRPAVCNAELESLSARAALNFAGCTWARLDGKSMVEYLPHEPTRAAIRALCQELLAEPAGDWGEAWERVGRAIGVARSL
ncbi:MAG: aminoglycoside phosphotransferase family protein [Pirellulales bacterium]